MQQYSSDQLASLLADQLRAIVGQHARVRRRGNRITVTGGRYPIRNLNLWVTAGGESPGFSFTSQCDGFRDDFWDLLQGEAVGLRALLESLGFEDCWGR